MNRAMRLAMFLVPFLAGSLCAETTQWWNAAFNSPAMKNKDAATTWVANNGDTMTKIVRTMYGIPADKQSTIDKVIDAVVKYNNALAANKDLYNADKVTPITDRNKIFEGKQYFVPDPNAINRIMKGEDPGVVMNESMASAQNQAQAKGEASSTPLHAFGSIEPDASDADATPTTVPPGTTTAQGGNTPAAPPLGTPGSNPGTEGTGTRTDGYTHMLGVRSEKGSVRADGAPDRLEEAPATNSGVLNRRGGISMGYEWICATPMTVKANGALKTASTAGVNAGATN